MDVGIRLIVGLGNPGERHAETRHNAGFLFVGAVANRFGVVLRAESRFKADIVRYDGASHRIWLLNPQTYMNLSGDAVAPFARYYKIAPSNILVAHDELDLPVGTVRLKQGGGHGGHNGLRDIAQKLGTNEFVRLRIGIGHPGNSDDVTDYVLRRASVADQAQIESGIANALDHVTDLIDGRYQIVMNELHRSADVATPASDT
ncbi:MAG: aminoacyl-tRNA hydrolase [Gammaproteobacteria bacterium]|nr:aminoacyl-tRNA hydrolase [Gammaproteobacteria bacterium]MDH3467515.1 aminoacyl-tRNA hydrolase [Gammaproteobacteria bacterium]